MLKSFLSSLFAWAEIPFLFFPSFLFFSRPGPLLSSSLSRVGRSASPGPAPLSPADRSTESPRNHPRERSARVPESPAPSRQPPSRHVTTRATRSPASPPLARAWAVPRTPAQLRDWSVRTAPPPRSLGPN